MEDVATLMSNCSNDELFEFVHENTKYEELAVLGALQELDKRGKMDDFAKKLQAQLQIHLQIQSDKVQIIDPQIELFSEWTVFGFALFFSPLFGAILLAYNMRKIGKSNKIIFPILFGLFYSIGENLLQQQISNTAASYIVSVIATLVGAIIIKELFWKLYIGKSAAYTKKSNLVPILIGLTMFLFVMAVLIHNGGIPTLKN
ncbi:MAG: hypothetical protein ABI199_11205 [Bacteroidia bacterium]